MAIYTLVLGAGRARLERATGGCRVLTESLGGEPSRSFGAALCRAVDGPWRTFVDGRCLQLDQKIAGSGSYKKGRWCSTAIRAWWWSTFSLKHRGARTASRMASACVWGALPTRHARSALHHSFLNTNSWVAVISPDSAVHLYCSIAALTDA